MPRFTCHMCGDVFDPSPSTRVFTRPSEGLYITTHTLQLCSQCARFISNQLLTHPISPATPGKPDGEFVPCPFCRGTGLTDPTEALRQRALDAIKTWAAASQAQDKET